MATITRKGTPVETVGNLPEKGRKAPGFVLVKQDLTEVSLADYKGKKLILNIFPSIDTPTCAMSVRKFNEKAAALQGAAVLCVSADLPFALGRFCGAEGIENVETASGFRSSFGDDYGLKIKTGALAGLYSRCIIIINELGNVVHTEQVAEIADEPDYDAALAAAK
jgi:thiol peroxidase